MLRLAVLRGWAASRNQDLERARSRVFRFAEHGCVHAQRHQRPLVSGWEGRAEDEISIRLAPDR